MKLRTDFVTNSCGSSFLFPRQLELTERQKEVVLRFVGRKLFGGDILSGDKGAKHSMEGHGFSEEDKGDAGRGLMEENCICQGGVDFEEQDYALGELYCQLWNAIEDAGGGNAG